MENEERGEGLAWESGVGIWVPGCLAGRLFGRASLSSRASVPFSL